MPSLNNIPYTSQNLSRVGVHHHTGSFQTVMAMDKLTTTPSGGLISLLTTNIDPQVVDILFAPTPLTSCFREVQKGNLGNTLNVFALIEGVGKPTTYGDWNNNSQTGVNVEFVERQALNYQQIIRVGDQEQILYSQGGISMMTEKQKYCALSLNQRQHQIYINGVDGLKNYGLLNDPSLSPTITGQKWDGDPVKAYQDFQKLYDQLIDQTQGYVDETTKLVLLVTPSARAKFLSVNEYMANNTIGLITKTFPNLTIVAIPQFHTDAGDYMQLICPEYNGIETVELGYNVKMFVHQVVPALSGIQQKRTQGCYGAIIKRPEFIATMLSTQ